jgi:beta-lactamase class A
VRPATAEDRELDRVTRLPIGRLQRAIEQITRSIRAKWGIYLKCIETGEEIAINADEPMDTMSVIKIPLMAEVFRQAEAGRFSLSDRVSLVDAQKLPGTGILQTLDAGATLTVKDLVTLMIIVSDNTATDRLYERVGGPVRVTELMRSRGLNTITARSTAREWFDAFSSAGPDLERFHIEGRTVLGVSSAREMGRLLELMQLGTLVSRQASGQMIRIMRNQVYSSRLPRYLPGFGMPHKTGDFLPYIGNDVGIIETPSAHVVVSVFTAHHNGVSAMLEDAIGRIAEQVVAYYTFR